MLIARSLAGLPVVIQGFREVRIVSCDGLEVVGNVRKIGLKCYHEKRRTRFRKSGRIWPVQRIPGK